MKNRKLIRESKEDLLAIHRKEAFINCPENCWCWDFEYKMLLFQVKLLRLKLILVKIRKIDK